MPDKIKYSEGDKIDCPHCKCHHILERDLGLYTEMLFYRCGSKRRIGVISDSFYDCMEMNDEGLPCLNCGRIPSILIDPGYCSIRCECLHKGDPWPPVHPDREPGESDDG